MLNASNGIIDQLSVLSSASFARLAQPGLIYVVEVVNGFFLGLTNGNYTSEKVIGRFPAANQPRCGSDFALVEDVGHPAHGLDHRRR
jgi:hypothetical protein